MSNRSGNKVGAKGGSKGARPKTKTNGASGKEKVGASGKVQQVVTIDLSGSRLESTVPGHVCKVCHGPDNEEMVQCDVCDKWHHYKCVGVTDDIADQSWRCPNCMVAKGVQHKPLPSDVISSSRNEKNDHEKQHKPDKYQKVSEMLAAMGVKPCKPGQSHAPSVQLDPVEKAASLAARARSATSQSTTIKSLLKLELQKLEEERAFEQREADRRRAYEQEAETRRALEQQEAEKRRVLMLQEAERRRAAELMEAEKHRLYLRKKYALLEQMSSRSESNSSVGSNRIDDWVDNVNSLQQRGELATNFPVNFNPKQHSTQKQPDAVGGVAVLSDEPHVRSDSVRVDSTRNVTMIPADRSRSRSASLNINDDRSIAHPERSFQQSFANAAGRVQQSFAREDSLIRNINSDRHVAQSDNFARNFQRSFANEEGSVGDNNSDRPVSRAEHYTRRERQRSIQEEEDCDPFQLSRKQLAARQAVSKDLPTFSGKPEEWPIFLSVYNSTTAMCGFSDEENVIRLQKCLKGKAYEAVQSRLMFPSNAPGVIATLRMLYGQPEAIVNSLIGKINSLPTMREDNLETIVDFAVHVQNFCATVDACGIEEYMYNVSLLHQLVSKLPPTIKLDWARYRQTVHSTNLATFGSWMYSLAEAASAVTIPPVMLPESKPVRYEARGGKKGNVFLNAHSETHFPDSSSSMYHTEAKTPHSRAHVKQWTENGCPVCKSSCKAVDKCKRFLELTRDSRWAAVREFELCRRCLRRHSNNGCKAKLCGKNGCTRKHHELLHNDQKNESPVANTSSEQTAPPASQTRNTQQTHGCNVHRTSSSAVLFRYLPVVLHGKHQSVRTYAFFDEGSELTLLDQELADELNLEGPVNPLCLRWTGGTQRNEKNSRVISLEVSGVKKASKKFNLRTVRTVSDLLLPHQTLDMNEMSQIYPHLRGLPIESYQDARPRLLIGMKHLGVSLILNSKEGEFEEPVAVKTRLGWTVCGGWNMNENLDTAQCGFHVCAETEQSDETLHQIVKAHFALDSLGIMKTDSTLMSTDDQRAQSLLKSHTQLKGNRYETSLLWRYDDVRLPDSRAMALRRHQSLVKRMEKDPSLAEILHQKIADYVVKGYARILTDEELNQTFRRVWYLPVFPVTNPNKPGKVRLVWDAAAKTFGVSLNSTLLKGADQLCSLFSILLQFREGQFGLTGDVREMFHQVLIRDEDQQCQRFFWTDRDGKLAVYVMNVMTFGACCSPSSAQYVKNLNAERFAGEFPVATEVISKRHYVDDMLVSTNTEEEAIQLAQDVQYVHSQGGFEIRNWVSNSRRILAALQQGNTEEKDLDLSPELATEKVLGMWWCTKADVFTYKIGWDRYDRALLTGQRCPTKREVLRVLMTIFDPLGLIAHFLMYLKVLLQDIWRSGIQWDDEINADLFEKWSTWLKVLPQVEQVQIPRCYQLQTPPINSSFNCPVPSMEHRASIVSDSTENQNDSVGHKSKSAIVEVQLHTFVDASENGIAAAVYLRFASVGNTECILVAAKTKVAPLKYHSIPRLELQAAVIGARLARTVGKSISIPITTRFFWSDSRDVLCWINSDHRRYSQFVGCRVSEILETTETSEWRWIPTKLNVADDGTKWTKFPDLSPRSRWFNGPDFLWHPEVEWPHSSFGRSLTENELRHQLLFHYTMAAPLLCVTDFSNWERLVNVVALVHRFPANCRLKLQRESTVTEPLSMEERREAEGYLLRLSQREAYPDELAALTESLQLPRELKKPLSKTSKLFQLTPWLDDRGILRMRSRIAACDFATEDAKKPIILPRDHHITTLIIAHYHHQYHHQNHETVINELRQKYHIPRIRVGYRRVRRTCQRCKNKNALPHPPFMADLPPARLAAFSRPFTHTGVDYFGPLEVVIGRRVEKRWVMLATCLTIRAIHLEVVHSLTTDSCIMALRNFISRRGSPRKIYSDRGTNFVGASREIKKLAAEIDQEAIMNEFVSSETEWVFNPPAAPHMGGSWERLIRTVKNNLMAVCPSRKPSDEVFRNLLTEIENIVNSRPLTHVPIDDDSAPALTPNHFLLGSSNGIKPLSLLDDNGSILRQGWRASQILANQFWRRWLSDYLPEITRRTKWFVYTKPIAIGDVVVIVDRKLPRNCWPLGKVIHTCAGKDGQIRSATVRTVAGVYERPTSKLAVLDVRCVEE